MKTIVLGMLAETAIHCGSGQNSWIVDLPIAREAASDYPFIPGSSLKGALRDHSRALDWDDERQEQVFGKSERAGNLIVSDARLLLLPVRSLSGSYKWLTCRALLERYQRDRYRAGLSDPLIKLPNDIPSNHTITSIQIDSRLFLEEREFNVKDQPDNSITALVKELILQSETASRIDNQMAIVSDDDFAWFCRNAIPIQARNVLESGTKQSNNLWYEEYLPADVLMYSLIMERRIEEESNCRNLFSEKNCYLQIGGNETTGQGWFAIKELRHEQVSS